MVQSDVIQQARKAHKQGKLTIAEDLYRQVLASKPDDPDANHLLGVIFYQREKYDDALKLIRKAVTLRPDHPATYNNLGSVQKALGMYSEALGSFVKAIELQEDYAEAHNNLGTVLQVLNRLDEAEDAYANAVNCRPDYLKAINNLGNLNVERKEFDIALSLYSQALSIDPNHSLSHYNLGCALLQLGRFDEAEAALLKASKEDSEMVEALNTLGRLYAFRFQYDKAITAFNQSLRVQPECVDGYIGLGNTYSSMNRFAMAVKCLERALAIEPDSVEALNSQGLILNFLGKPKDAFQCMEKAHRLSPENVGILCNLGSLHMANGAFEESIAVCRKALAVDGDCAGAYFQLAQLMDGKDSGTLVDTIASQLRQKKTTPMQEMQLHFGLAKLLEDQEEYQQAFKSFTRANKLKRETYPFSFDPIYEVVDRICEVYDEETLRRFAGKGCTDDLPIFIVGLPRSGSTLVEQILASHPDVYGAGELSLFAETVSEYFQVASREEMIPANLNLQAEDLPQLGKRYVEQLQSFAPSAKRVTDKMLGNYMQLGLISLILPKARIIHCRRDPRDTCLSIFKKLFSRGHQYAYDLHELGEYYCIYRDLMEHWDNVLPGHFLDFCYEDLISDQEGETRRLLEYCGLEWNERCLYYYEHNRSVYTASSVQVRTPLTNKTVSLWKQYEEGLHPLLSALKQCL